MAKDLPKMHVQTCIIWGRMTKLHLQMSLKSLTTAELHFILDRQMRSCGDDEHPEEFNRLLEDWLTHTHLKAR
jgi:hypothetical protein